MRILRIAAAVLLPAAAAAPPADRIVFRDAFSRRPDEPGDWRWAGSAFCVASARDPARAANAFELEAPGPGPALALGPGREWRRYRVRAAARGSAGAAIGIAVGCRGEGEARTGFLLRWTARGEAQRGRREIVRVRGGSREVVASAPGGFLPGSWYTLEGRLADGDVSFGADGRDLLSWRDPGASSGGIGLYAEGPAGFDDVEAAGLDAPAEAPPAPPPAFARDPQMRFWAAASEPPAAPGGWPSREWRFGEAAADFRAGCGRWDVAARWACDPRWTFLQGNAASAREPYAVLWLKRAVDPRAAEIEAFVAPPFRNLFSYERARDLDIALSPDASDPAAGYAFLLGGFGNRGSAILRRGRVVARDEARPARIHKGIEMHQGWYRVRVSRDGGSVRFRVERFGAAGEKAVCDLSFSDPEPLDAGRVAFFTASEGPGKGGMVVARVRIASPSIGAREDPDGAPAAVRLDGIRGFGPEYAGLGRSPRVPGAFGVPMYIPGAP